MNKKMFTQILKIMFVYIIREKQSMASIIDLYIEVMESYRRRKQI